MKIEEEEEEEKRKTLINISLRFCFINAVWL
jgi:hypothetical protein